MATRHGPVQDAAGSESGWPLMPACGLTTATVQGPAWSSAAGGWFAYWAGFAAPARAAVAQAAGVAGGVTVLDVGCGSGEFCALAAGLGARVSGIDAAAELIALAKRQAPGADLRVGAMEALPWAEGSFDLVTGFNAFQFASDFIAALIEARRVTRRGGRVAICNWGQVAECEIHAVSDPLRRAAPPRPPGIAPHDPPPIGEPTVLEHLVEQAGLAPERAAEVDVPYRFRDRASLERALLAFAPAYGIRAEQAEQIVHSAVRGPATPFRQPDGSYRFGNRFRYLIARAD